MLSIIDHGIYTVKNVYTDTEIEYFEEFVYDNIYSKNTRKFFNNSKFKNSKIINNTLSNLMYSKISPYLPEIYTDRQNKKFKFIGPCNKVFISEIDSNQDFIIHTDTGCFYDINDNSLSKFTVLTYLNGPESFSGGETVFYDDLFNKTYSIKPERNKTLIFDIDLFHSANFVFNVNTPKRWIGTELICQQIS